MNDLLLLGDYFFDIIFSGLVEFPSLGREVYSDSITSTGGAMFITASSLRRLGANITWIAQFGNDPYSRFVYDLAVSEGIDLSLARFFDAPYRRITSSMPLHGERAFLTYVDPEPEDMFDFWLHIVKTTDYRHIHLGGLEPPELIAPIFKTARARGATISMDCQDDPLLCLDCDWQEFLSMVDIFMPNTREALMITKLDNVEDAALLLSKWVGKVVIKDGANGVWVASKNALLHSPAIDAGQVVDTTGAGDCFNAGFLFGHIVEGQPDEVSARYGNICGGLSVTGIGGATNVPTRNVLMEWAAKLEALGL